MINVLEWLLHGEEGSTLFFIFSFDLLLYAVLLVMFLLMLVMFPVLTLILTGLIIWGLVAAFRGRGGADEEE